MSLTSELKQKKNYYVIDKWVKVKKIIMSLTVAYIYKIILKSILFRSILFVLFALLNMIGLSEIVTYNLFIGILLLLIFYCVIKSNDRFTLIIKLSINISIIIMFWYFISNICGKQLLYCFLGYYMLFGFDDIDFSDIINSYKSHNFSWGEQEDPNSPKGPKGPNTNPFALVDLNQDQEDYNYIYSTYSDLKNFKQYLLLEDKRYNTVDIKNAIEYHNKQIKDLGPTGDHMVVKKYFNWFYESSIFDSVCRIPSEFVKYTPMQYTNLLQWNLHNDIVKYNTLIKAKCYYETGNEGPHSEFKDAFDLWHRKQILYFITDRVKKLMNHEIFSSNVVPDAFSDEFNYSEIKVDLAYCQLDIMLTKEKLSVIDNAKSEIMDAKAWHHFNSKYNYLLYDKIKSACNEFRIKYEHPNAKTLGKMDYTNKYGQHVDWMFEHFVSIQYYLEGVKIKNMEDNCKSYLIKKFINNDHNISNRVYNLMYNKNPLYISKFKKVF